MRRPNPAHLQAKMTAERLHKRIHPRGFTLIELMITVGIIAILVAVAIPTVYNYRRDRVSMSSAQGLTDFLRGLRHFSASRNAALQVRIFQGDGNRHANATPLRGNIQVFVSNDNTCGNVGPNAAMMWDISSIYPNDNVQITHVSPAPRDGAGGSTLQFCIKPDGRIVNDTTLQPVIASPGDSTPAEVCRGEDPGGDASILATWNSACNRDGVICLRVGNINNECPDPCPNNTGECPSHFGLDHFITLNYAGEVRMVR